MDAGWKKQYETGNPRIDFEHRVFLDLVSQFGTEAESDASPDRLRRTATEIFKYADFHFYSEETLMLDVGYPDFDHHHRIHISLLNELRQYIESIIVDSARAADMSRFLFQWFVGHTVAEDTKLARYVAAASPSA